MFKLYNILLQLVIDFCLLVLVQLFKKLLRGETSLKTKYLCLVEDVGAGVGEPLVLKNKDYLLPFKLVYITKLK